MEALDGEVDKMIAAEATKPKPAPKPRSSAAASVKRGGTGATATATAATAAAAGPAAARPPAAAAQAAVGAGAAARPPSTGPSTASAMDISDMERMAIEKERVERQEREVRSTLEQRLRVMQQEAAKLASIRQELAAMSAPAREDIQILRRNIEACERELSYAKKDYDAKKAAFEKAEATMNDKSKRKDMLVAHLNTIILDLTRKKEEKLKQLTQKLGLVTADATPAAAEAALRAAGAAVAPSEQKMFEGFS